MRPMTVGLCEQKAAFLDIVIEIISIFCGEILSIVSEFYAL